VAGDAAQVGLGALDLGEHAPGGVEDAAPGCGQDHAPPEAGEKRGPDPPFDVAQLVTERRLRQAEAVGSPGHRPRRGDFGDQPQVAQLEFHAVNAST
jgi:hypothetical protein